MVSKISLTVYNEYSGYNIVEWDFEFCANYLHSEYLCLDDDTVIQIAPCTTIISAEMINISVHMISALNCSQITKQTVFVLPL